MSERSSIRRVMVTGATGFVGRHVIGVLLDRGLTAVCLVRPRDGLSVGRAGSADPERLIEVMGTLSDWDALREAAESSEAVIHLAGIILERRLRGQTFRRVHVDGTRNVVEAAKAAGIRRFIHMSALGTVPDARSPYHRSKWAAEEWVRGSGLDWTIFRPSLIHGPDGEFMRLMRQLICGLLPPAIPYFGTGQAKIQPISVKDVALCVVEALSRADTIGQVYPLGGPEAYSWIELYNACRAMMPGARRWKPAVGLPVPFAKVAAVLSGPPMALAELIVPPVGRVRFDRGQVDMSQEDNVCDHTLAERAFGIGMRAFEDELGEYASRIR